jgi:hypothetical protein
VPVFAPPRTPAEPVAILADAPAALARARRRLLPPLEESPSSFNIGATEIGGGGGTAAGGGGGDGHILAS